MREPDPEILPSSLARHLVATRPGFLGATLVAVLIGLAAAAHAVDIHYASAAVSLVGALCAHAGFNVLNDVYDHLSGSDNNNDERIFPYTGGSRVIQNGLLSSRQMTRFGIGLLAATVLAGIVLLPRAGYALIPLGLGGLLIGWAYSAPPLRLCARGAGELCVGIGFGILIPVATALVQSGELEHLAVFSALPYGLLLAAALFINQFPDLRADAASGKRNLVVRLGPARAWPIYPALTAAAYLALLVAVATGTLPVLCLSGLATAPLHAVAALGLRQAVLTPARLEQPIRLTLLATLVHGALIAVTVGASV